jgi:transposase
MAYIQGEFPSKTSLFPVSLEELIPEDHLVRVIDLYVAKLDLVQLGFDKALPKSTGRPSYDPADQLKLYLYGYFQRIRSSRRLEAECQRNIEVMWLINRLKPDFKTIADFRKNNKLAFVATCRAFVQFCRMAGLIAGDLVAIDGSKFQAVASSRRHMNLKQLKRQEEKLDKRIAQYLAELDEADKAEAGEVVDRGAIKTALAQLEVRQQDNHSCQALMSSMGLEQFNTHESDARMMRKPKGPRVAYNVQTAVDAAHCLILHHEVTQDGDDRKQLEPMAKAAKEHLEQDALSVTADAGYSNGQQFQACEEAAITVYVPPNRSVNPGGEELFERKDCWCRLRIDPVPSMLLDSLRDQWTRIIQLDEEIRKIELRLKQCLRESSDCQKIAEIPGIGLLTATAAVASLGDATTFHSGRQFAAWLGLVPRQTGTGGRVRQLGLSKRGDTYLRTLLMHGARSILNRGQRSEWVERLLTRRPYNVAVAAVANKLARTLWAVLAKGSTYRAELFTACPTGH